MRRSLANIAGKFRHRRAGAGARSLSWSVAVVLLVLSHAGCVTKPVGDPSKAKVKVDAEWHTKGDDPQAIEAIKARKLREMQEYPPPPHEPVSSKPAPGEPQRAELPPPPPAAASLQPDNPQRHPLNPAVVTRLPPTSTGPSPNGLAAANRPDDDRSKLSPTAARALREPAVEELNSRTGTEPDVQLAAYVQQSSHQRQQIEPAAFEGKAIAAARSHPSEPEQQEPARPEPAQSMPPRDPDQIEITTTESSLRLLGFVEGGDGEAAAMVDFPPHGPRLVRARDMILWKDKHGERMLEVRKVTRRGLEVKDNNEDKTIYFRK